MDENKAAEGEKMTAAGTAGEGALRTTDCAFPYVSPRIGGRFASRRCVGKKARGA